MSGGGRGGPPGGGMGGPRFERGGGGGGQFQGGFGGSNFLVGQQNGIASTNSFGLNYSDNWGDNFSVQHSYFFNRTQNQNLQNLQRQYFTTSDSTRTYDQLSDVATKNFNHRLEMRFEYTIDTMNSIILQPRLYFQDNNSTSYLFGTNILNDSLLLNRTTNGNKSNTNGNNLNNQLTFRHRFETTGRTFSIELRNGLNNREGTGEVNSLAAYYRGQMSTNDTINQHSTTKTVGTSFSSRIVYTEPIAENTQLQFSYNPSFSKNNADNRRSDFSSATNSYSLLDTSLSNQYENKYTTQNAGVAYRWRDSYVNLNLEMSYQIADLEGEQVFPFTSSTKKTFYNLLPSAFMQYKISETDNIHSFYRTSTREPSINQLQNVVDNSNPLLLTSGNPDLKPSLTHTLMSRYSLTSVDRTKTTFLMFMTSYTNNYIGNSTVTSSLDSTKRGAQLTYPVNLDDNWSVRSFITHGFPVATIKSNLNINAGYTFSQTPGLINNDINITNSTGINFGIVVSSNISEDVDYTISYSGNYNISRNSLQKELDNNYYYHNSGLKFNATFWEGVVLRNELTNTLYTGLGEAYSQNYWLWNLSLGKKIFSNQNGELRLTVTDLLNQNTSVNRSVTETYVEDSNNQELGKYLLLMFTYTIR
ncbi:MAG: outer membrane beta-barrel protein, partial [Ignavibacteriae bacterium]|nr:outer membrane beta-barrel protein [Ignavibacteriota bacterium]